jgi:uncharacterized protein YdeI (YjbR/CyaY-like superfamily)
MLDQTKKGLPILLFEDQPSFEKWLRVHSSEEKGIWLMIAKKGSLTASINYDEAVESALCYGWIDSQGAAHDDQYYLQKLTPRRARSKWSRLNQEKAEALIASGRMQPAGYHQVELAKQDGRWETAYDPQSAITVPEDFQEALDNNEEAREFFSGLNGLNRYAFLHRLQLTKKPETRTAKIQKFTAMLASHKKIHP